MTGALELKGGLLDAKIMLNLDTEDDHELTIGCAGGIDITARGSYDSVKANDNHVAYKIAIKGLTGGHSGMDIHLGRGNANKLMNRFLFELGQKMEVGIHQIDGGSLRNAIPRESFAVIAIAQAKKPAFLEFVKVYEATLTEEYSITDPNIKLVVEDNAKVANVVAADFQKKLLRSIYACPNGIYRMSPDIKDLVQTSNNLARVQVKDGAYEILCLTRSSVDTEKMDEAHAIQSTFELLGAKVTFGGAYPGWTPKPESPIVKIMSELYQELFKAEADVNACHAGLECGILGTNYPEMQMISFGPNIRGAHSPDEKVQISSVQKFWGFLLETLKRIPVKG